MNKSSKKKAKYLCLLGLILLSLFFWKTTWNYYKTHIDRPIDPAVKYDIYGQDKYTYFGDGRFQINNWPTDLERLNLTDSKYTAGYPDCLTSEIKWYNLVGNNLYVEGTFQTGTGKNNEGVVSYWGGIDPSNGETIMYADQSEIPTYVILNIETGEARYFITLGDMPLDDRSIFEMELTPTCLEARTCYQEGVIVDQSWWDYILNT